MATIFRFLNRKLRRRSFYGRFYSSSPQAKPSGYGKIFPETPETLDDLINYLKQNVIFRDDRLIVCSKPFGIRIMSSHDLLGKTNEEKNGDRQKLAPAPTVLNAAPGFSQKFATDSQRQILATDSQKLATAPTILNALPALSREWKIPELRLAKFQIPLQMSGPVIFTLNEKSVQLFHKSCSRSMKQKIPIFHGISICVGIPNPEFGKENFCVRKKILANGKKIFLPEFFLDRISKKQILKGNLCRGTIEHEVLHSEKEFSLVFFASNNLTNHFVRVYLTYKGAPILGDDFYQQRIARIFGHPILLDPEKTLLGPENTLLHPEKTSTKNSIILDHQTLLDPEKTFVDSEKSRVDPEKTSTKNQYIPLDLLKRMNLSLKDYHDLPQFCHINRILLLKFDDQKTKDLVINLDPPDYFLSAMNLLGISEETLNKSKNKIEFWRNK